MFESSKSQQFLLTLDVGSCELVVIRQESKFFDKVEFSKYECGNGGNVDQVWIVFFSSGDRNK